MIAVALMAVVGLTFGFASTALGYSGVSYAGACSGCHTGAATSPVATQVSNSGTTATYTVSGGGTEWALFNGSTRVTGAVGSTGQFAVPVPGTYTLFAVLGTAGGGTAQGLGQTAVVVSAPLSHFTIAATAGPNGSVSPEGSLSATQGANVTYTFTPDSGYHVAAVTVDGTLVGGVTTYTFTNVQAAHTIDVTFAVGEGSTYTITATAGDNGSINPTGDREVPAGGSVVYTMQPAEGYQVATMTVDGAPVAKACWYTFLNVVQPHTISVTFKPNPAGWFTVTPYAGEHGQIWMAQQTVQASDTAPAIVACSIIPDAGYHVESMVVDGRAVVPATSYIFYNVRAGHTIEATFEADPLHFDITASAGANGSISHAGSFSATEGVNVTYTFTPDSGYHVESVTVDGVAFGGTTSYTFTNVQATHTIDVTFGFTKLATTLSIKRGASSIKHGRYVTISGRLSGGVPAGTPVVLRVMRPGRSSYITLRTVTTSSTGYWSYRAKLNYHGAYYFRARFEGCDTHLACAVTSYVRVLVR